MIRSRASQLPIVKVPVFCFPPIPGQYFRKISNSDLFGKRNETGIKIPRSKPKLLYKMFLRASSRFLYLSLCRLVTQFTDRSADFTQSDTGVRRLLFFPRTVVHTCTFSSVGQLLHPWSDTSLYLQALKMLGPALGLGSAIRYRLGMEAREEKKQRTRVHSSKWWTEHKYDSASRNRSGSRSSLAGGGGVGGGVCGCSSLPDQHLATLISDFPGGSVIYLTFFPPVPPA